MTKAIHQLYTIKAPISMVWQALTDPRVIGAWGAGPATMTEKENEAFSLWGGEIWGKNREVVKEKSSSRNGTMIKTMTG